MNRKWSGRAAARLFSLGRRGAFVALSLFLFGCVQAPKEVVETLDAAVLSATRFRDYSVEVQRAYRTDLGAAWARERAHVMKSELERLKDSDGKVSTLEVEDLLKQEKLAANRHLEQLVKLAKRDDQAAQNWQAFRKTIEALRRYLASGMTAEERAQVYAVIADTAERLNDATGTD